MTQPWHDTEMAEEGDHYAILMAGKPVRTPLKRPLLAPTRALADALVAEWRAQGDKIAPDTMPLTRYMNSIIDAIADNRGSVVDTVAAYGETDLLCYRAGHPAPLVARQAAAWDGPLTDYTRRHNAPMVVTTGVLPVDQPPESLATIRQIVEAHDDVTLAALHDLTAMSGSIILAIAISDGQMTAADAWTTSRVDEVWQIESWGEDDLATEAAEIKHAAFMDASRLLDLARLKNN